MLSWRWPGGERGKEKQRAFQNFSVTLVSGIGPTYVMSIFHSCHLIDYTHLQCTHFSPVLLVATASVSLLLLPPQNMVSFFLVRKVTRNSI